MDFFRKKQLKLEKLPNKIAKTVKTYYGDK